MSTSSHNRVEPIGAPELHAERDAPERASDAPVISADNVVPFTRLRRGAVATAASPEIPFDPSQRPAPHFIRDRGRLIVPLLALSLIVHGGLYLLFNRPPPPMASIGLEVMSVEIVLGANTPAGAASAPGENETQSAPADAPKPVETDTETADAKPQQPETPPVQTAVETPDLKPQQPEIPPVETVVETPDLKPQQPETPPVETAQAAPPEPQPVQEPPPPEPQKPVAAAEPEPKPTPPEPTEAPQPEKQEVATAPVEPQPPEPTPEPAPQAEPRETPPPEQQVAALPTEPEPPKPEPPKPEQQVVPVQPPRERPPETAKPDKPDPKPVRTQEPQPKERAVKPKQERNAKTKQDRAQRTASLDPNATGPRANASSGVGVGSSQALSNYNGLVSAHLRRYQRYPDDARSRGEQGVASVSFGLDGGGRVTSVAVVRRTGFASLDQEVQSMVRRASPFPAPPDGRGKSFTVPVAFRFR
jgi:protein TonB